MHDAHKFYDMFVFLKAVEQDVLFKLRERQDAQPTFITHPSNLSHPKPYRTFLRLLGRSEQLPNRIENDLNLFVVFFYFVSKLFV
jgi:hypothetical protein